MEVSHHFGDKRTIESSLSLSRPERVHCIYSKKHFWMRIHSGCIMHYSECILLLVCIASSILYLASYE